MNNRPAFRKHLRTRMTGVYSALKLKQNVLKVQR
jgi:hypothetical protein